MDKSSDKSFVLNLSLANEIIFLILWLEFMCLFLKGVYFAL